MNTAEARRTFKDVRTVHLGTLQPDGSALLVQTGMAVRETQDITANVLAALRSDSARKMALIERAVGARLAPTFREFAAVEGSEVFAGFESGATVYLRYALRK